MGIGRETYKSKLTLESYYNKKVGPERKRKTKCVYKKKKDITSVQ